MMEVVIVDDEPIARDILVKYISKMSDLHLAASFDNPLSAREYLRENSCDLLLLDIEMPQLDGLSVLRSLPVHGRVILTTAYREYALDGFEVGAVDYLVKPISFERFLSAINKLYQNEALVSATKVTAGPALDTFMYFKSGTKVIQVFLDQILLIEGLSNYVKIHTSGGVIVVYQKLSFLENKLSQGFLRVHKSFIVPISKIRSFTPASIEIDSRLIPIGEKYKDKVLKILRSRIIG